MKLLHDENQWVWGQSAVALGMFDGVHIGHAALVAETRRLATEQGVTSTVYTFAQHPLTVLRPELAPPMLTTAAEKTQYIARLSPAALVLRPFDAAFAALPAEDFVAHLVNTLSPREVVVGFNYSFGARGLGDPALLMKLGQRYGFATRVLEPVCWQGEPVSSSRVRAALAAGQMAAVTAMLGRAYSLEGIVQPGKRIGRTLGFPTANLGLPPDKALPPFGVYAGWATVGEQRYAAVLNMGRHPTLPEGAPTIEVFLLDARLNLYGQPLAVTCEAFLRPEQKFADAPALQAQIERDVRAAREVLAKQAESTPV